MIGAKTICRYVCIICEIIFVSQFIVLLRIMWILLVDIFLTVFMTWLLNTNSVYEKGGREVRIKISYLKE